MRAKGPLRVLVLLLAATLMPLLSVSAHHGPTAGDVVAEAQGNQGMTCSANAGQQICTGFSPRQGYRSATITPDAGPLTEVVTSARALPQRNGDYSMDPADKGWNTAMHNVGCAKFNAVTGFLNQVAALTVLDTSVGPTTVGECTMTGQLSSGTFDVAPTYIVTSQTLPSALPTATPTPTVTPTATAKPTAKPTARPTPSATATASPTATPSPTPTPTASPTATVRPVNTPEQSVLGVIFTPEPSSAAPAPAGGGGADWAQSVPSASEVSTDAKTLASSGLAVLLLLLAMGFIGELFNNTFETNYDRILAGWQKSSLARIGKAFSGLWGGGK